MMTELLTVVALMLVLEGIMPFACPGVWRKMLEKMQTKPDRIVRMTGLITMLIGLSLLIIVRQFAE